MHGQLIKAHTGPRRCKGCRTGPLMTRSKSHRNCSRAKAENTSTFNLFQLSFNRTIKTSECHLLKHAPNAMKKKARSGLLSHNWGWCIWSLRVSIKPLVLKMQFHSKWKAWSPCQYICSLASPRFVIAKLRFSCSATPVTICFFLLLFLLLLLIPSPLLLLNSVLSDQDNLEAKADENPQWMVQHLLI